MNGYRDIRLRAAILPGLILIITALVSLASWAQEGRCLEEGDLRTIGDDVPRNAVAWPPVEDVTTVLILDDVAGPSGQRPGEILFQSDKSSGRVTITERRRVADVRTVRLAPGGRRVITEPEGLQGEFAQGPDSGCIARHPDSDELFEVTKDGRLIEMTADGATVLGTSRLDVSDESVNWADVQACTIAPSADSTDAEQNKRLFILTHQKVCEFGIGSN